MELSYILIWSNASDFISTDEQFGTVKIHSAQMDEALDAMNIDSSVKYKGEMAYLCYRMSIRAPFLPVDGPHEMKLFNQLILEMGKFDESLMAIEWCKYVDGIKICEHPVGG